MMSDALPVMVLVLHAQGQQVRTVHHAVGLISLKTSVCLHAQMGIPKTLATSPAKFASSSAILIASRASQLARHVFHLKSHKMLLPA